MAILERTWRELSAARGGSTLKILDTASPWLEQRPKLGRERAKLRYWPAIRVHQRALSWRRRWVSLRSSRSERWA